MHGVSCDKRQRQHAASQSCTAVMRLNMGMSANAAKRGRTAPATKRGVRGAEPAPQRLDKRGDPWPLGPMAYDYKRHTSGRDHDFYWELFCIFTIPSTIALIFNMGYILNTSH